MSADVTPQAPANAYPQRGPNASRTNPVTADPQATPTEIPVDSQAIASVDRPGGACSSSRLNPAIRVGAMVIPLR
jgi:hypothetical protein